MLTSRDINFNAHCFYLYLVENFFDMKAISLGQIQAEACVDREEMFEETLVSFIPTSTGDLCSLCEDLNNSGHILFLKEPAKLEFSWVKQLYSQKSMVLSLHHGISKNVLTWLLALELSHYRELKSTSHNMIL